MKFLLLALLAVGLAACGLNANKQIRAPKIETPPEGDIVEIDGTNVHYVSRGQGAPLILIHGAGGSSREWTFSMMDKLASRYRVIAVDRPGHGYTDRLKGRAHDAETLKEQADLVHALAGKLGIDSAHVAGQSYGGGVALALAVHHPEMVDSLTVISGVSNLWEGGLDPWYENTNTWWGKYLLIPAMSFLTTRDRAEDVVTGIFEPDDVPPGYLDHMGVRLSARSTQIRANTAQINRSFEDIEAQVGRYGEISVPVEIIHGDKDTTVPLDVHAIPLSGQIEGANLTVLNGTGHMPQHAREAEVIAAIDRAANRASSR